MNPDLRTIRFVDALRLNEEDWLRLMDAQERTAGVKTLGANNDFRRHERLPYRSMISVGLITEQPGGGWVGFKARSRNLSESGIGLYHGQYIHVGSRCEVLLKDKLGMVRIGGTVRRCKLLTGRIHELGIEFEELIPVDDFILSDLD